MAPSDHKWSKREWLTVRFGLAAPVALNAPWMFFDGLIAHMIHQRVLGREYYNLPSFGTRSMSAQEMGRYRRTIGLWNGLNAASVSLFNGDVEFEGAGAPDRACQQYFKRPEADDFPGNQLRMTFGHFRAWMLRTVYVVADSVDFRVNGNRALIGSLLEDVTHLGNDTRVGWGRVASVEILASDRDESVVGRDGRAMRPIPTRLLARWDEAVPLPCRPPYWDRRQVELCAPPGAKVEVDHDAR